MKPRYIVIIVIALLCIPILLNWVLQIPSNCPIIGNSETWLQAWITYAGVLISSTITFVVLFSTIRSNKKNLDKSLRINNQEKKVADISIFLEILISELTPTNWFKTPIPNDKSYYQDKSRILTMLSGKVDLRFIEGKSSRSEEIFVESFRILFQRYSKYINRMLRISIALEQDSPTKASDYIKQTNEFDAANGDQTFPDYFNEFFVDLQDIEAMQVFLEEEINKEFRDAIQYCYQLYTVLLANSKSLKQSYVDELEALMANDL